MVTVRTLPFSITYSAPSS